MRSGWLRLVQTAAAGLTLAVGVWAQGAGAAEVKNVKATYLEPWGRVGISYEVRGTIDEGSLLVVTAKDRTKNVTYYAATNMLSGDTGTDEGMHRIVWNLEHQGVTLQASNVTFTVTYYDEPLYCVVDLSAGANASSYPVTYMDKPPIGGFNTDEYKTTKLAMRRIDPGTFTMGSPSSESGRSSWETPHKVTLARPYYIGLFEVTQKQYALVTGINPSKFLGDKRPVEQVSWNTIRGNTNWPTSSAVSASSFMGRLRARTGQAFDLPTEAQWEYACRAGMTTAFSYGESANGDYMWYSQNSSKQTHDAGTKKANAWGLYDMHGNVEEWCLDWSGDYATEAVTEPKGPSSGAWGSRMLRGGHVSSLGSDNWSLCRSASRGNYGPASSSMFMGFRLAIPLSE